MHQREVTINGQQKPSGKSLSPSLIFEGRIFLDKSMTKRHRKSLFADCAEQQFKTKINTLCMWQNQLNRTIQKGILGVITILRVFIMFSFVLCSVGRTLLFLQLINYDLAFIDKLILKLTQSRNVQCVDEACLGLVNNLQSF